MRLCTIYTLLFLTQQTIALNILLTSENSWVSAGLRSLYTHLTEVMGHNVILVAPLHQNTDVGAKLQLNKKVRMKDFSVPAERKEHERRAGDFKHLANYKSKRISSDSKVRKRGAKGVLSDLQPSKVSKQFGVDPEDKHIYYVDGSPLAATLVGLDYIIPYNFPEFSIDLILAGPNEGSIMEEGAKRGGYAISHLGLLRDIPSFTVSSADSRHYYFKDTIPAEVSHSYGIIDDKISSLISRFESESHTGVFGRKNYNTLKTVYSDHDNAIYKEELSKHQEILDLQKQGSLSYKIDDESDNSSPFNAYRVLPRNIALSINFPAFVSDTCINPPFSQTTSFSHAGNANVKLTPTVSALEGTGDDSPEEINLIIESISEAYDPDSDDYGKCHDQVTGEKLLRCILPGEREVIEKCGVSVKAFGNYESKFDIRELLRLVEIL
ncbi:hypothetical protein BABINDRAFT_159474 [Babjeviella inositovora NRRL Y-12698]|uniref:Survival protein SurE-like phosphatase/nucleotidase domain-containing protein n=1 Tax=Babjeviella inositovora NRRL Y-12698 TaxID=984486 RepID=A0A1E3QZD0_9ASCO|nr:uncharacterized protein BABINDRAFT_159474 [Babjeviella inositovora NRRL Y-12698]ODQ82996.1 hypothetical protein BABINDRAFT_159474 [Babjeviella inositovora NRRL Y-12698]